MLPLRTATRLLIALAGSLSCSTAVDLAGTAAVAALTPTDRHIDIRCPRPEPFGDSVSIVPQHTLYLEGFDQRKKGADTLYWEDVVCDDDDPWCEDLPILPRKSLMAIVRSELVQGLAHQGLAPDTIGTARRLTFRLKEARITTTQKGFQRRRLTGGFQVELSVADTVGNERWSGTLVAHGDTVKVALAEARHVEEAMSSARCRLRAAIDSAMAGEDFLHATILESSAGDEREGPHLGGTNGLP